MNDLVGKTALVTGAGKGVGREIARSLARRGADIALSCLHSYEQAEETRDQLVRETGVRVEVIRASLDGQDQVDRLFDEVESRFGGLDILVIDAASHSPGPPADGTPEHFANALDTTLVGSFRCARRAAPLMASRGGGTIVNVSPIGAGRLDDQLVTGTAQAGVEALTRHLAAQYGPLGIRVNTASCGLARGDVADRVPPADEPRQGLAAGTPPGRTAEPADLVGVVTFLTSDLSRWVTGQVVLADGGLGSAHAVPSSPPGPSTPPARTLDATPESRTAQPPDGVTPVSDPSVPEDDPVVVVGMGLAVPGANSPAEYWQQMVDGAERFVDPPQDRWKTSGFGSPDKSAEDKSYQARAGFIEGFVPDPDLAEEIAEGRVGDEYTTQWLRHSLHQALRGVTRREVDRVVFAVGYTADGSQHLEEASVLAAAGQCLAGAAGADPGDDAADTPEAEVERVLRQHLWRGRGNAADYFPYGVARNAMMDLLPEQSRVYVVDTACSSSLYTIDIGLKSLLLGECDVAVCGGAFALAPRGGVLFSKLHGLSATGVVRSLDRSADGVLFSDGAGVVVLKRLSRALADGDRVLGVVRTVGTSADGKGKAIYAPNSAGQRLAVERAMAAPGARADHVDWVIAHATGTPAGDLAEITTLRESLPTGRPIMLTSNKALIGHTGWAAGVVSVIEALLALQHSTIPRQHRFEQAPQAFALEDSQLVIPREPVPWPRRSDRPRTVSVSGFGFGGTNAHALLEEYVGQRREPVVLPHAQERVAVVAWSAHLPGLAGRSEVREWARGSGAEPRAGFGDHYPLPSFQRVRIPPSSLRTVDRCQLMLLECMFDVREQLGGALDAHRELTGVFAGHMGPTRNGVLYALRCYLDPLRELLATSAGDGARRAFERAAAQARALVPPANEDSCPGIMPNVIPARVTNYIGLQGLNMTVDTGPAATLTAVDTASKYLRTGDLDVALVVGVNGNAGPYMAEMLDLDRPDPLREGAVMFALMREGTAREHGLPVLGFVTGYAVGAQPRSGVDGEVVEVGPGVPGAPSYLGADGAVGLLRALVSDSTEATVRCTDRGGAPPVSIRLAKPAFDPREAAPAADRAEVPADTAAPGPDRSEPEPSAAAVRRHVITLQPQALTEARGSGTELPFLPPDTLVLTDDASLVDAVDAESPPMVLSTRPVAVPGPGRRQVEELSAAAVRTALDALPTRPRHVRVLTDLTAHADAEAALDAPADGLLALHDLVFLALQALADDIEVPGGSVVASLLGAVTRGQLHPFAGLFTGLVKSTALELPEVTVFTVATGSRDPRFAVRQAELESRVRRLLPLAVYDDEVRKVIHVQRVDPPTAVARLDERSVVLAAGGSRGITAEILKELARRYRPTIYVLGSQAPGPQVESLPSRVDYLRQSRERNPDLTVAEGNRAYARLTRGLEARRNLDEMARLTGGRVHFLTCDVRDSAQVDAAVRQVLESEDRVDLVVNAAGINRASLLRTKSLEDFRAVRDLKVEAYQNLRRAFGDRRPALWCNFSSLIGFRGQPGEVDYAAANDFLATASTYSSALGHEEFAIGWNLWRDVGFGASPIMRSLLFRLNTLSSMSTEEGIGHFIRELDQPDHAAFPVLMGDGELVMLGLTPEQVQLPPSAALAGPAPRVEPAAPVGRFYLGREEFRSDQELVVVREFDLERDPYLAQHLAKGQPTLPGTFVTEAAAEAARVLVPDRVVVGFSDLTFSAFLRLHPGRPATKRIRALVIGSDEEQTLVRVTVTTDVIAPGGRVIAVDRPHFSVVVRLRDRFPAAPRWERWDPAGDGPPTRDPYLVPNPWLRLSGVFDVNEGARLHEHGARATFALRVPEDDPVFRTFLVPTLLLDGLLRVGMLYDAGDGFRALAAPTGIGRIDLYEPGNDIALSTRYGSIELHHTPPAPGASGAGTGRWVAATPDGRVLARIEGTTVATVGLVDPATGAHRDLPPGQERSPVGGRPAPDRV
ncbi:SDR family oxidoreductase [Blastococcus mobilis]|uniref:Ketoacyl-synthetase C-terminal extension n=1 Tax=Blastococcus mobilis TaxID=1938746 RepID=A0A238UR96_9ACTN|nr:SDR family oxidoreductase [Blastococcus mobilis]SNR24660.1 Ketoacyl-synthetase C-terminal extension [Blastococcus mobilis]